MLDVTPALYLGRTVDTITLPSFLLGIFKGRYFGVVVALTGCLRGMQCGSTAAAVGLATKPLRGFAGKSRDGIPRAAGAESP
jgi:phospholipid/cholesterol/gamma-HCH transport system permease protein